MMILTPTYRLLPKAFAATLVVLIVVNAAMAFDNKACCGCCQPPPEVAAWQPESGGGCCTDVPLCGWSGATEDPALPALPPPAAADAQPQATVVTTGVAPIGPESPLAVSCPVPARNGPPVYILTCILLI